jgi:hypothetical protein
MKFVNIVGVRYTRLTVVAYLGASKWQCICDCGQNTVTKTGRLNSGHTKSCGCLVTDVLLKRNTTHGLCNTKAYTSWRAMKERCTNAKYQYYARYGGRGISYDPAWNEFEAFFADMGSCSAGLSLDRIDSSAGYNKQNCRWADIETQLSNTSQNVYLTYNGETLTAAQWGRKLSMPVHLIYSRARSGWSVERTLSRMDP